MAVKYGNSSDEEGIHDHISKIQKKNVKSKRKQ